MDKVEPVAVPATLPRPVEPAVVEAVLGRIPASATRDRALFTLVYETGVRIAEALGLYVHDLDLVRDNEKIRVLGKGNRERTVLLTAAPRSIRLLRRHLKLEQLESSAVFRGDLLRGGSNQPMDYTTARRSWNGYCQAAGHQVTLHQLRHTRATELKEPCDCRPIRVKEAQRLRTAIGLDNGVNAGISATYSERALIQKWRYYRLRAAPLAAIESL